MQTLQLRRTFRKRGQNFAWNFALTSSILVGGGGVILLLLYNQMILASVVALISVCIAALAINQIRKRWILVTFDGDTLQIQNPNGRVTIRVPFAYETGIRYKQTGENSLPKAYLQLIIYDNSQQMRLEEAIAHEQQPPALPTLAAQSNSVRYRNVRNFPDVLWELVQALGIPPNPDAGLLIDPITEDQAIKQSFEDGKSHLIAHEFEEALTGFSDIVALSPAEPTAYYNRGVVYLSQSKLFDKAIDDFTHAIVLDERYLPAYKQRAKCYLTQHEWDKALTDATIVLQTTPDAELLNLYGVAQQALKQFDQALKSYSEAIKLDPNYARAYHNRGLLYRRLKKHADGDHDLERAKHLESST